VNLPASISASAYRRAAVGTIYERSHKGIITTTSDFPPKVTEDPLIAPFLPTRLELVNGANLQKWLIELGKQG
jgi:restriction system protein